MRPAHSYQSPSMTPPDDPFDDLEIDGTKICNIPEGNHPCGSFIVVQDDFDDPLCYEHYVQAVKDKAKDDEAEAMLDAAERYGEYPQFYDGTGSW